MVFPHTTLPRLYKYTRFLGKNKQNKNHSSFINIEEVQNELCHE